MGAASGSTQDDEQAGLGLPAGTELVLLLAGMELDCFFYFADNVVVTSFEPLMSAWRGETDPDRFVPQMAHVGLDVEPPADDDESEQEPSPTIALLKMLTLALGIRLSRDGHGHAADCPPQAGTRADAADRLRQPSASKPF